MKYLLFEKTYQLESTPCDRCDATGRYAHPSPRMKPDCLNCRGLGRKITRDGRFLFYLICDLLGKPVTERESRIDPKHLETIWAHQVKPGMCVGELTPRKHAPAIVTDIEPLPAGSVRLTWADSRQASLTGLDLLARNLTEQDHLTVDTLMAMRVGRGAVEARARANA